tara:strand:+ start:205 stop:822 length:618 start_codon:yes stop_codon:yes gene_type:complete
MCHPVVFTAMGASASTAATLAAVAPTIIGVAGSSMLGMQQAKAQQKYAATQHKLEQEAVSDEATQRRIESVQKENIRKQDYLDRLASNRATLAGMGISGQGGSIRALLQENKNILKKDLRSINLNYKVGLSNLSDVARTSDLKLQSEKQAARTDKYSSLFKGTTALGTVYKEFNPEIPLSNKNKTLIPKGTISSVSDVFKKRKKI